MMNAILHQHEIALRQIHNMSTSSITYSSNVDEVTRGGIQSCLGLEVGAAYAKYVGLPTLLGRD